MPENAPPLDPAFRVLHRNVFADPTDGVINIRLLAGWTQLMDGTTMTEHEKEHFFRIATLIAVKLASCHEQVTLYAAREKEIVAEALAEFPPKAPVEEEWFVAQDLFLRLDLFLVQMKSALDHLVKLPGVILGKKRWHPHTFGDKGNGVLKQISSLPKEHKPRMGVMLKNIVERHQPWLISAVGLRDEFNHFIEGKHRIEEFSVLVSRNEKGEPVARVPMLGDDPASTVLDRLWWNLFLLCEDFGAATIGGKLQPGFALAKVPQPAGSIAAQWVFGLDDMLRESLERAVGGPLAPISEVEPPRASGPDPTSPRKRA